jgi:hypothetical protein
MRFGQTVREGTNPFSSRENLPRLYALTNKFAQRTRTYRGNQLDTVAYVAAVEAPRRVSHFTEELPKTIPKHPTNKQMMNFFDTIRAGGDPSQAIAKKLAVSEDKEQAVLAEVLRRLNPDFVNGGRIVVDAVSIITNLANGVKYGLLPTDKKYVAEADDESVYDSDYDSDTPLTPQQDNDFVDGAGDGPEPGDVIADDDLQADDDPEPDQDGIFVQEFDPSQAPTGLRARQLWREGVTVIPGVVSDFASKRQQIRNELIEYRPEVRADIDPSVQPSDLATRPWEGVPVPSAFHGETVRSVRVVALRRLKQLAQQVAYNMGIRVTANDSLWMEPLQGALVIHTGKAGGDSWSRDAGRGTKGVVLEAWVNLGDRSQDFSYVPGTHSFRSGGAMDVKEFPYENLREFDRLQDSVTVPPGAMVVYYRTLVHRNYHPSTTQFERSARVYVGAAMYAGNDTVNRVQTLGDLDLGRMIRPVIGPTVAAGRSAADEAELTSRLIDSYNLPSGSTSTPNPEDGTTDNDFVIVTTLQNGTRRLNVNPNTRVARFRVPFEETDIDDYNFAELQELVIRVAVPPPQAPVGRSVPTGHTVIRL